MSLISRPKPFFLLDLLIGSRFYDVRSHLGQEIRANWPRGTA
jgi:hypothetical protein